jgi:hypothetical protein
MAVPAFSSADDIEAAAERLRTRLSLEVSEISHRSSPAYIAASVKSRVQLEAGEKASFVADNITKDKWGWIAGAAAVALAYRLGKSSHTAGADGNTTSGIPSPTKSSPDIFKKHVRGGERADAQLTGAHPLRTAAPGAFGLAAGFLVSLVMPKTRYEEALLSAVPAAARDSLRKFVGDSYSSLPRIIANSFGVSRYVAISLVGLSALSNFLAKSDRGKSASAAE